MKTVVLTAWDQAVAARKLMGGAGAALVLGAAALGLAGVFGVANVKWPTVVLTLLATHAITAHFAWRRIAQLQAALDMKRMILDHTPAATIALAAGDRCQIDGLTLEVDRLVTLKVIK